MSGLFRRVLLAPAIVALAVLMFASVPLWLLVATVASTWLPGRWRPVRLLFIGLLYFVLETVMLVVMFGLWLASGFGGRMRTPYFEGIHYDLMQVFLGVFFRQSQRVLHLEIETVGPAPDASPGKPLIVCSRHAGPGDSFILVHALLSWYHREPRIVLKNTLAWDPMIDVLLTRLPARFVNPNPKAGQNLESAIAALASNLDGNDAFVIFPEGGNFTPARRERGIARLRKLGLEKMADRAEQMTHVLAPRPGGVLAALDAAPDADVVLVAHTGLDHLVTVSDIWRELPMDKRLLMRWWRVPRAEIPDERDARIDWLFTRWEQIDTWIADHRPVELPAGEPVKVR